MTDYPVNLDIKPGVQPFFDEATNTISYIVKDPSIERLRHRRQRDGHRLRRWSDHL